MLLKNVAVVTELIAQEKYGSSNCFSLSKVEHVRKLLVVDQIFHLANLRMINKESAIFLVRHYLDKSFYEQLIGRNINFRSRTKPVFLQPRILKNLRIEY